MTSEKLKRLLSFAYVSFLCCWLIGSLALLVKMFVTGEVFFVMSEGVLRFSDWPLFYSGGQIVLSDQRQQIYDSMVELAFFNRAISPYSIEEFPFVEYPPLFFLIMAVFAFMPMRISYVVWCVLSAALLIAVLIMFLRLRPELNKRARALIVMATFAFLPTWVNFKWGQTGILLFALICVYFWCFLKRRDVLAGAMLALTTFKLQYLPILVTPAFVARRWVLVGAAAVAEAALLTLCGLIVGWQNVWGYPQVLLDVETSSRYYGVFVEKMVNVRSLLNLFLPKEAASAIAVFCFLAGVVATFFLWRAATRAAPQAAAGSEVEPALRWATALTLVICLMVGLHAHVHDCVFLALVAALTLPTVDLFEATELSPRALKVWCLTLIMLPLVGFFAFVYYDIAGLWGARTLNPFAVVNVILLVSGILCFRDTFGKSRE